MIYFKNKAYKCKRIIVIIKKNIKILIIYYCTEMTSPLIINLSIKFILSMETISLHVGQCGIQVAESFWNLVIR